MTQKLTTVIPAVFNDIRPGATFMAIMGYENNFGELSNFGLVFHVNYLNAVRRSVGAWLGYKPQNQAETEVRRELIESYTDTLNGHNPRARSAHAYTRIVDAQGRLVKGTKYWIRGQECHLWAFRVHKRILRPGEYPPGFWHARKAARHKLMQMAPIHNYRQFKLVEGRFNRIQVAKLSLTDQDLLRSLN